MENLWPLLALAGLGALHGLSPTSGWLLAVSCGAGGRDGVGMRRALLAVAVGHAAAMAVAVAAFAAGAAIDRGTARDLAGIVLVGTAAWRWRRRTGTPGSPSASRRGGPAGIAVGSFFMAVAHGAGTMWLPALAPLCLPGRSESMTAGSALTATAAAVVVHTAAMLATTGAVSAGVRRGIARLPGRGGGAFTGRAGSAALAATGIALLLVR